MGRSLSKTTATRFLDRVTESTEVFEISRFAPAVENPVQAFFQKHIAHAAGRAVTATLVSEETHEIPGDLDDVSVGAENHECTAGR